jgi:hypothetical protein
VRDSAGGYFQFNRREKSWTPTIFLTLATRPILIRRQDLPSIFLLESQQKGIFLFLRMAAEMLETLAIGRAERFKERQMLEGDLRVQFRPRGESSWRDQPGWIPWEYEDGEPSARKTFERAHQLVRLGKRDLECGDWCILERQSDGRIELLYEDIDDTEYRETISPGYFIGGLLVIIGGMLVCGFVGGWFW